MLIISSVLQSITWPNKYDWFRLTDNDLTIQNRWPHILHVFTRRRHLSPRTRTAHTPTSSFRHRAGKVTVTDFSISWMLFVSKCPFYVTADVTYAVVKDAIMTQFNPSVQARDSERFDISGTFGRMSWHLPYAFFIRFEHLFIVVVYGRKRSISEK